MRRTNLGEFEELVLLVVGVIGPDMAYGITIKDEISKYTGRSTSVGALHSALYRLEMKGFLETHMGGATNERGGRRKKYYKLSASGKAALTNAKELRNTLYEMIPNMIPLKSNEK